MPLHFPVNVVTLVTSVNAIALLVPDHHSLAVHVVIGELAGVGLGLVVSELVLSHSVEGSVYKIAFVPRSLAIIKPTSPRFFTLYEIALICSVDALLLAVFLLVQPDLDTSLIILAMSDALNPVAIVELAIRLCADSITMVLTISKLALIDPSKFLPGFLGLRELLLDFDELTSFRILSVSRALNIPSFTTEDAI